MLFIMEWVRWCAVMNQYWPCLLLVLANTEREFHIVCHVLGATDINQFTRFFVSSIRSTTPPANSAESLLWPKSPDRPGLCEWLPSRETSVRPCTIARQTLTARRLVIFTLHDISAGEELCISYKGLPVRIRDCEGRGIADHSGRRRSRTRQDQERRQTTKNQETKDDGCCSRLEEKRWSQGQRYLLLVRNSPFEEVKLIVLVVPRTVMGSCSIDRWIKDPWLI